MVLYAVDFQFMSKLSTLDIASKEIEGLIVFLMILVTSISLSQLRSLDIVTLGTYQQIHFRVLCYGEEILRGNESLESGNMKDLTFCWVKVHVPVLFPLLEFT